MPRARLPQLQSITEGSFEPNRRNPVLLGEDSFLDDHQKPIRIGESASPLSLSKNQIRIDGDFYLEGKLANPLLSTDFDYLELRPKIYTRFTSSDFTGSLDLYVTSGNPFFLASGTEMNFLLPSAGLFKYGSANGILNQVQFDMDNGDYTFTSAANASHFFRIDVDPDGVTTLQTAGTSSTLTLDTVGDIELNADGGDITFKDNTVTLASLNNTAFYSGSPIFLKEKASAEADVAGQGQVWVKDDAPNCLAFTDDAGTDIVGIGKYHYETKFIGFYGGQAGQYIPMTGYIIEKTSSSSNNEFISFVAPYNGTIEKFIWRSEAAQDGGVRLLVYESSDGTEVPSVAIFRSDVTVDIADDTAHNHTMTSPSIGSDYSPLTKDRIYAIFLNFPATPYDTNITIVFKWDITS